jgi:type IV secretory pathway VirB2 component (pilin)
MPWDSPFQKIIASFTGLAYGIAIIGCVGAGAALIFAQELPYFLKAVCFIMLAAAFMCGANAFASTMGWTGAVV